MPLAKARRERTCGGVLEGGDGGRVAGDRVPEFQRAQLILQRQLLLSIESLS